jgi:hypothetical protein
MKSWYAVLDKDGVPWAEPFDLRESAEISAECRDTDPCSQRWAPFTVVQVSPTRETLERFAEWLFADEPAGQVFHMNKVGTLVLINQFLEAERGE